MAMCKSSYPKYPRASAKIFESCDVIVVENYDKPMVILDVPHVQTHDVFEGLLPHHLVVMSCNKMATLISLCGKVHLKMWIKLYKKSKWLSQKKELCQSGLQKKIAR